jgi:hypothetical protein
MNIWKKLAAAILIGFASGVALTIWCMHEQRWLPGDADLEVGASLFKTGPDEVLSFSYSAGAMIYTAQRSASAIPFVTQVTYTDERPFQRCIATPDLAGALTPIALATITAKADQHDSKIVHAKMLGLLELQDVVIGDPNYPWVLFTAEGEPSVLVRQGDTLFKTSIQLATIKKIEAGCSAYEK